MSLLFHLSTFLLVSFLLACPSVHINTFPAPLDDCLTLQETERLCELLPDGPEGDALCAKAADSASYCRVAEGRLR